MSKSTIRNFILVALALAGFTVVVSWSFVLVNKNSQLLEEKIAAVASQTEQQSALTRLQTLARESEGERAELKNYFLQRESDTIVVLSKVESLAPQFGLDLETSSLQPVAIENQNWMEIVFVGTGSRAAVENFLSVLEEIPYVSRVTSARYSGTLNGAWDVSYTLQVQLLDSEL